MTRTVGLLALITLLALPATVQAKGRSGDFDYYALTLSWSPEHCAAKPSDREQCSRKLGFVLHGLWPQYLKGYPSDCSTESLAGDVERDFPGLYPSRFLYRHEWQKHGTCSGLSQPAFHQLAEDLRNKVQIPADYQSPAQPLRKSNFELKADLASGNEWLAPDTITLACADGGRFLREIYICVNKAGTESMTCPDEMVRRERRSCAQPDFLLRNVR
ncbi:ribonuclease T2 family protein [Aeromonas rivuli]|uniref:ribonuclease T2 family protein n=1 Tax=Aeromonas rivuli TaxID=648794 RepID=UPI001CCAFE11|nr:ribonuclease [Aeromonas rivuli]UBO73476.1 ribonuclease [Aeromonas rivuli]